MARTHSHPWSVAGLWCLAAWLAIPAAVAAQTRPPARPDPPPPGQRLEARDGDIVIVEDDARVQLVQRKQGAGRVVYDAQRGWVMVLLDANSRTSPPDGNVDWSYRFAGVAGEWPLGERWEGPVVVDQYRPAGTGPSAMGIVIEAAGFTISFLSGPERQPRDAIAIAVVQRVERRRVPRAQRGDELLIISQILRQRQAGPPFVRRRRD